MAYIYEFSVAVIGLHGKMTRTGTLYTKIRVPSCDVRIKIHH